MSEPSPSSLRALESWMVQAIVGSEADVAAVEAVLTGGPRLSARERFDIYRSGYRARLVECLADDYPVLAGALGEQRFQALCHAYIERYPSNSPSLNYFGRHMAEFCRQARVPEIREHSGFWADLAALEWALVEAIHAEVVAHFDIATFGNVPVDAWATARLVPSAAVTILRSAYPVNAYYQACQHDEAVEFPSPRSSATVIYRQGLNVWRMALTPAMADVLEALLAGAPIGEALTCIARSEQDADALAETERSVTTWFEKWVAAGFFAGVRLDTE